MTALVRAAALTNFSEVVSELGCDPDALLRQAGFSAQVLRHPDHLIDAIRAGRVLEDAARASGCESVGLRMAARRQLSNFGIIGLLLMHQPTLREVLVTLVEHLHLLNERLAIHVEEQGPLVILREELVTPAPGTQSIELAIGVLYRMGEALLGERWRPISANFVHRAPASTEFHRHFFKCRVEFDAAFNGLVCRAEDLDVANPGADPRLADYARRMLAAESPSHQRSMEQVVRKAIYLMLPVGRANCKAIAQGLGWSVRTLQRALDAEGVTFKQLLNEVRRDLAGRYLSNPRHSLGDIAAMLGYSSQSAFTRWFGAQFGCPPELWRRNGTASLHHPDKPR
jgi:AraC-like DNA-binding protein